ncbi:hemerythrin domain-containing protein [Nocardioides hwasunensis]|uniref:Hemerythrin domain-containing protein n=1 Tax=Nocardioides hwasunensis TaxID=397258 RepID=A0ABR8ME44_9ACTN|nr:hemerythrin domain-containing protein [Nocardioides hwasunensis]MBD3913486.1 hemerythrin domain-containing protein [Nocardioides hwasunensis]
MSEPMSMNQVIHAAVRRDVARTEQALRALDDGDGERARQVQTAWRNLVRELTHHHEAEDTIAWPFLASRGFDTGLLEEMEAEHVAMKNALTASSAAIDAVVAAPTATAAVAAADEVARAREVINGHLDHEEADVEGIMGDLEQDPEWKKAAAKMRPASLVDAANALAWMQDGAGERELSSLRATIPGPVVTILTKVVARRYHREVAPVWR